ncbi:hypothetical protein BJ165DRAFT_1612081 [Panaeolus papilionaceus]|nr:hypothetical protein BJ165DRAFT_1612081 [Panaeolus papilionaceus]
MKLSKSAIATVALLGLEYGVVVKGQTNHIVNVDLQGNFFDPPLTSAQVNDTITFIFQGDSDVHTVTQSSFDAPCAALPRGFNSGEIGGGANLTNSPLISWTLTITNASTPIYFFCEITRPASHCNSGMVGVINALPNDYNAYLSSAHQATGIPTPSIGVVLSGVGAFATAAPSAVGGASPATTSPPPSQVSSKSTPATKNPSVTPSSSNNTVTVPASRNKLLAIVGGAVGGAVALLLALFAVMIYRHRLSKKKYRRRYFDGSDRPEKHYDGRDSYASLHASP